MLTEKQFHKLIKAASLASSADNMQPWEFKKQANEIEVFVAKNRLLPTDTNKMFSWMGIGAAIQNIVVEASSLGLISSIEYQFCIDLDLPVAIISFVKGNSKASLAEWIPLRFTNRADYEAQPLKLSVISRLTETIKDLGAKLHWTTNKSELYQMAFMDANSSYIRLEHKPFYDELFNILRFTKREVEESRYGLDFKTLGVPTFSFIARLMMNRKVNNFISRVGIGRLVAKQLASRLQKAGALFLITAKQQNPAGYMEAGRAMQQFWLKATAEGLSIQPYGVLPQYLTKMRLEPAFFKPQHAATIESHRKPFYNIFPGAKNEYPAIVLRVGYAKKQSYRSNVRLLPKDIVKPENLS